MIWRYALGGKTFTATWRFSQIRGVISGARFKPSQQNPRHGTALLRTCRQVFLETASYPITLGSFWFDHECPKILVSAAKDIKAYQRKQVSRIGMAITHYHRSSNRAIGSHWCPQMIRRSLPAAKDLELLVRDTNDNLYNSFADQLCKNVKQVWRKENGWTTTVRITSGGMES